MSQLIAGPHPKASRSGKARTEDVQLVSLLTLLKQGLVLLKPTGVYFLFIYIYTYTCMYVYRSICIIGTMYVL